MHQPRREMRKVGVQGHAPLLGVSFSGAMCVDSIMPGRPSHTPADWRKLRAASLCPLKFGPAPAPKLSSVGSVTCAFAVSDGLGRGAGSTHEVCPKRIRVGGRTCGVRNTGMYVDALVAAEGNIGVIERHGDGLSKSSEYVARCFDDRSVDDAPEGTQRFICATDGV